MKPGCGREGPIRNWVFGCSNHPGEYETASRSEFYNALGALNNL